MYYLPRSTWTLPRTVTALKKKQKNVFFRIKIHADIRANLFFKEIVGYLLLFIYKTAYPHGQATTRRQGKSCWFFSLELKLLLKRPCWASALATRDAKLDLCSSAPFPLNLLLCPSNSFSAVTKGKWVLWSLTLSRCISRGSDGCLGCLCDHVSLLKLSTSHPLNSFFSAPPLFLFH